MLPLIVLLHVGFLVGFSWFAIRRMGEQVKRFREEIPQVVQEIQRTMETSEVGRWLLQALQSKQEAMGNELGQFDRIFNVFSGTLGVGVVILVILVFGFFLVAKPGLYVNGILVLVPPEKQDRIAEVIIKTKNTLYRWFIGKVLDMSSIFVLTLPGLWILDIPLKFTLAFIAFLFSFVPNLGPVLSALPPIAIAFIEGPNIPLYGGLLYLGIQLFESHFITPNIQKDASFVPPVLLLLVQILFGAFMGVLGLLLATPILAAFMVSIKMLYDEDYFGTKALTENAGPDS